MHSPGPCRCCRCPSLPCPPCRSYSLATKECWHRDWSFYAAATPAAGVVSGNWDDQSKAYWSTAFADADFVSAPFYSAPKLGMGDCSIACERTWAAEGPLTGLPHKCWSW